MKGERAVRAWLHALSVLAVMHCIPHYMRPRWTAHGSKPLWVPCDRYGRPLPEDTGRE
jgi:hypothetical protein